jgi:hypothetical protein
MTSCCRHQALQALLASTPVANRHLKHKQSGYAADTCADQGGLRDFFEQNQGGSRHQVQTRGLRLPAFAFAGLAALGSASMPMGAVSSIIMLALRASALGSASIFRALSSMLVLRLRTSALGSALALVFEGFFLGCPDFGTLGSAFEAAAMGSSPSTAATGSSAAMVSSVFLEVAEAAPGSVAAAAAMGWSDAAAATERLREESEAALGVAAAAAMGSFMESVVEAAALAAAAGVGPIRKVA